MAVKVRIESDGVHVQVVYIHEDGSEEVFDGDDVVRVVWVYDQKTGEGPKTEITLRHDRAALRQGVRLE